MLAAVESKADIPVVYVETRDRRIIHLDGQGSHSRDFDESALKDIDVERYLAAYSVTVLDSEGFKAGEKRRPFPNDSQAVVAKFIAQTPAAVDLLDRFRGGNQPGKGRDYLCPITRDQLTRGERHALEFFQTHGIVRLEEAKKELCICVFSRYVDFIWGDWLECYTYNVAALLTDAAGAPFFDDCRLSVTINWEGRQQTEAYQDPKDDNEIDVVAIRGARLVACECKAGADMLQSDWIYKLEAVTRPTGLYCDRVLVTSRKRREGDRDYKSRMRRALNLGVVVVTTETLEKLGEILRDPTAELERLREEVSGW
jgi:hypothetical protein